MDEIAATGASGQRALPGAGSKIPWAPGSKAFLFACLAILFAGALGVRVFYLDQSRLLAEHQYRSALLARTLYFAAADNVPDWRRQAAGHWTQQIALYEPPVMESIVASVYRLLGAEHLWIPRLLSAAFWLMGGFVLFKLAVQMFSPAVALGAVAYFWFAPSGIHASVSFLPDSLMILLFVSGLLAIVSDHKQPSSASYIMAVIVSGTAMFIKPFTMLALPATFVALKLWEKGGWRGVWNVPALAFLGLAILPNGLYYGYGIVVGKSLDHPGDVNFLPHLFLYGDYWRGWLRSAIAAAGLVPLLTAALGFFMLPPGSLRPLLIGSGIGYILFCLFFTFRIPYGGHHHLPLVVLVALACGPILALVEKRLQERWLPGHAWAPAVVIPLLIVVLNVFDIKNRFDRQKPIESPQIAREIGQLVGHSNRVVYVASYYGKPLEYYGELSGTYWPRPMRYWALRPVDEGERGIQERLKALAFLPEFFVITDLQEFERHHADLRQYLTEKCPLLAKNDQYLIYGGCSN
jgi:hypothetical protein